MKWRYNFWTEEHSRRNQKQARRGRGSNQWAEGQGRKKLTESAREGKLFRKNEELLSELKDIMKHNNICIIRVPEGEEKQGLENIF